MSEEKEQEQSEKEIQCLEAEIKGLKVEIKYKEAEIKRIRQILAIERMKPRIREYYEGGRGEELYKELTDDRGEPAKAIKEYVPDKKILEVILKDNLETWMELHLKDCNYVGDFLRKVPGLLVNEIFYGYNICKTWVQIYGRVTRTTFIKNGKYFHFTELIKMSCQKVFTYWHNDIKYSHSIEEPSSSKETEHKEIVLRGGVVHIISYENDTLVVWDYRGKQKSESYKLLGKVVGEVKIDESQCEICIKTEYDRITLKWDGTYQRVEATYR